MLSVDDINRLEKENETLKDALYNKSEVEESLASAINELTEVKKNLKELLSDHIRLAATLKAIECICKCPDLYRGRQALATKIQEIINKTLEEKIC